VIFFPTDCDRFDPDALLDMGVSGVVGLFWLEDLLAAERVDEGCASWLGQKHDRDTEGFYIPVPLAPQTMSEKSTPFLMFFFLRILIYAATAHVSLLEDKLSYT
jgi:hypothetical protein